MKILLLGMNGQVGWELQRSLAPLGELIALDAHSQTLCGDFTQLNGLANTLQSVMPDIIVNAAAYTAVDKAESEPALAQRINAQAPELLAQHAARHGAWLVHYSTDYVFDGSGSTPWREDDAVSPINVYGATKLAGEQAIQSTGCKHLIFRTSWVYAARGGNFAKTMLRLAGERDQLAVIDDQHGAPTGAELLADVTAHALRAAIDRSTLAGVYHLVAAGETSWHGYARYVIETARALGLPLKAGPDDIRPVTTDAYPTAARRPHNSRMNTAKFSTAFGLCLPDWKTGVARMLTELHGNSQ